MKTIRIGIPHGPPEAVPVKCPECIALGTVSLHLQSDTGVSSAPNTYAAGAKWCGQFPWSARRRSPGL